MRNGLGADILTSLLRDVLFAYSPLILVGLVALYFLMPSPVEEHVILLPGPDGKVGEVVVKTASGNSQTINTAFGSVGIDGRGKLVEENNTAKSIEERYGVLLVARPPRPKSFTLYFASGSATELDATSRFAIQSIKSELSARPEPEITVIGHTDTVGALEANDALSKERAAAVRDLLVAAGIPAKNIEVAGRGEREPMIHTMDDVDEPMNRRVVVNVR